MLSIKKQKQFAQLAVKIGANMQPGQEVVVRSDVACSDFAHLIAQTAYENGAKRVHFEWQSERLDRLNMDCAETETLCDIPNYRLEMYRYMIEKKCCLIAISAKDPNNFLGVDPDKILQVNIATRKAVKFFREATMSNLLRWTLVSIPTPAWAKTVYPNLPEKKAVDSLWQQIGSIMRLDTDDPVEAWEKHIATLHRRAKFLNSKNFEYVHFTSKNGTDLKVGLATDHFWTAAQEEGQDGIGFTANMPTEEIFTAPHRNKTEGVVKNALPLVDNGNIIDGFSITFKDGKVIDFSAQKGFDALKGLLSADEGVLHLGEIALIGKGSPIAQSDTLFYNTLFDENASCHLAFGKAYPTTVKNGNDKTPEELLEMGVNDSTQHVDFMIGTKDLHVEGIGFDGSVTVLFDDGEWVV